jgi:ubiquinone/menaquinone biosynthesis C-methylase UbiE
MHWLGGFFGTIASLGATNASVGGRPLLPAEELIKTGPIDEGAWHYRRLLGWIFRRRFALILSLLPRLPVERLLEVGYGSGVFMPSLAAYCRELHGLDIHLYNEQVAERLERHGVSAALEVGSVEEMRYPDNHFDCVVAVSVFDFVPDMERASRELRRVLKPDGALVTVLPADSPLIDAVFHLLTGKDPRRDFGDRRSAVLPALLRQFVIEKERSFPVFGGRRLRLYRAFRLRPKG